MGIIKIKQANEETTQEKVVEQEENSTTVKASSTNRGRKRTAILREDLSKKDENTSHYILNNGTAKTVITAEPTNYFDEETKEWKEVDNTLEDKGEIYENKRGKLKTQISKATRGKSVKVGKKDMSVSWSYLGKKTKDGLSLVSDTILKVDGKKVRSKAVYENADKNTDLEYKTSANSVKENIIVKEKSEDYKYQFALNTEGLQLRLSEDNTSIELCKEDKVEFRIPAPFMYDAKGVRSDDVYYELEPSENNKYIFTVVADADWINDKKREMPVTIDPQINVDGLISLEIKQQTGEVVCDSCCEQGSVRWRDTNLTDWWCVNNWDSTLARLYVTINKSAFSLLNKEVVKAEFVLTPLYVGSFDRCPKLIAYEREYFFYSMDDGTLRVDITDLMNDDSSTVSFTIEAVNMWDEFDLDAQDAMPYLEVISLTGENEKVVRKNISVAGIMNAEVNLGTGDYSIGYTDISSENSIMGIPIEHYMRFGGEDKHVGKNFRLNLNETFKKNSSKYVYTDAKGNEHGFKEYFYYLDETGKKEYLDVSKSSITVETDGTLKYGDQVVEVEYKSITGLKAETEKEGYKNIKYLEQRTNENKQIEEQIRSFKDALTNYKLVDTNKLPINVATSNIIGEIVQGWRSSSANEIGKTEVETLLGNVTDKKLLLDESDALNYISIKNRICYYKEYSDVNISTELNESSVLKIFLSQRSIMDSRNVILGYLYNMPSNYHRNDVIFNLKNLSLINISNLEFIEINKQYVWKEPSSCVQKSNIKAYGSEIINMIKSFNISVEQLNIQKDEAYLEKIYLEKQLQMYQEKSVNNKETFKTCAKEYFNLLEQKKEADAQTPINFLSDGHYIKGYNKEGKFIILFDKYENYAVVEYEQCYSKKDTRIARLYDNKENVVTFEYNTIDQLTAIKDVRGRKVSYKYEEGRLKEISFDTGEHVVLYYNSKGWISKVAEDKNCLITTIEDSYSSNLLTISEYSPVSLIGEGTSKLASECDSNGALINKTVVEEHLIDDLMDYVTVSNDEKQEVFKFNRDNNLHEYYELINNKVVKGERYEYANYWEDRTAQDNPRDVVVKLHKDKINTEYSKSFIFVDGDESKTTLNQFNLPASKVEKKTIGINGLEKNVQTSTTTYFYDDNQKLVKEEIVVQADYSNGYTLVKKYNYNLMGDVVRTETYVKGEESLKGKEIEETIYDKTGNAVKSFRYNTLDSSSKLYIETEYSEENKVVAEYDETGENKTEIEYVDGTNIVREQKLPNGSKFVYGHDSDDSVSAISHSTEDGEENSTQRKYNLGRLVKLTSGNNSVEYEYDAKGRTTKVKLNGTDYATYNYTEQNDSLGRLSTRTTELSHYSGHSIARVEDAFGREVSFKSGTDTLREFTYSENKLYKFKNKDKLYRYEYDLFDNLTSVQEIDSYDEDVCSGLNEKTAYNYCGKPITKTINGLVNHNYAYEYRSDASKTLDSITFNNNLKVKPQLDCLGRNKGKEILYSNTKVAEENISYIKVGDHATNMPATIWFGDKTNGSFQVKDSIRYAYDKMGNLEKVYDNGELAVRYAYDALNRLVREDNKYNN